MRGPEMGTGRARLTRHARSLLIAAGGSLIIGTASVDAHKAVTSKYTYTEEVFPILRDKCGQCHAEGGAAPMSLLAYKDASGGAVAWPNRCATCSSCSRCRRGTLIQPVRRLRTITP